MCNLYCGSATKFFCSIKNEIFPCCKNEFYVGFILFPSLIVTLLSLLNDGVANVGSMPTAAPSAAGIRKSWHEDITQDLRNHLVHKLWVWPSFPLSGPEQIWQWNYFHCWMWSWLLFHFCAYVFVVYRPYFLLLIQLHWKTGGWRILWLMPEKSRATCTSRLTLG